MQLGGGGLKSSPFFKTKHKLENDNMKIQCILERKGGTIAEVGGIEYHFEPLEDGAHVAEVADEAHIDRFLSIGEAYKVYHGKLAPEGKPAPIANPVKPAAAADATSNERLRLFGSSMHPPSFDVNGNTYTQMEIIKIAFEASRLSEDDWNELPEEDRGARIDMALDDLFSATEAKAAPAVKRTRKTKKAE